jgi:A/G-specific adenine glycosylase
MDPFAAAVLDWFDRHGRHDLPWQVDPTPYRVWVSEIMLQQTQVTTVIPYYTRFVARFPDVTTLADAPLDEVLHHWTGLGYYARARNLHAAARAIAAAGGDFPRTIEGLAALPGIGRSTAGAIAALGLRSFGVILDGNVRRVLARHRGIEGHHSYSAVLERLWHEATLHTPRERNADYTQAMMDLGATLCTRHKPGCALCPVARDCVALATDRIDALPMKRPAKAKPVRSARMFVVTTPDGATLLERRPRRGLWGGLWTPPERSIDTSPDELCLQYGIHFETVVQSHAAPAFRHTFTHFHLDIEPIYLGLDAAPEAVMDTDDACWYQPAADAPIGLAAPAVKLLATVREFQLD